MDVAVVNNDCFVLVQWPVNELSHVEPGGQDEVQEYIQYKVELR
jgi:hypothetical protein